MSLFCINWQSEEKKAFPITRGQSKSNQVLGPERNNFGLPLEYAFWPNLILDLIRSQSEVEMNSKSLKPSSHLSWCIPSNLETILRRQQKKIHTHSFPTVLNLFYLHSSFAQMCFCSYIYTWQKVAWGVLV